MKIKQLAAYTLFCSFVCGSNLLAMKELQLMQESGAGKMRKIIFAGKGFSVSQEILKNFGLFEKDFESLQNGQKSDKKTEENHQKVNWDITRYIKSILSEKNEESQSNLVTRMLTVASNGKVPSEAQDEETLFTIIQMADCLHNQKVMKICTPVLMKKLFAEKVLEQLSVRMYDCVFWMVQPLPRGRRFLAEVKDEEKVAKTGLFYIDGGELVRTYNCEPVNIKILPGGEQFFAGVKDGGKKKIGLINVADGTLVQTYDVCSTRIELLPGGKRFFAEVKDGKTGLFNINGELVQTYDVCSTRIELLPGGKRFFAGVKDGKTGLFNINGELVQIYDCSIETVKPLPGGKHFLAKVEDGKTGLFNVADGTLIRTYECSPKSISVLVGERRFFAEVEDGKTGLFHIDHRKPVQTYNWPIWNVRPLPGGKQFFFGSNRTACLINIDDGGIIQTYNCSVRTVKPLAGGKQFLAEVLDEWRRRKKTGLFNIDSFEDLTFEQIRLCYNIFSKEKKKKLDEYDAELLKSLPKCLQDLVKKELQ